MPLFRLLRITGVSTALADVLAGYLLLRFYGAGRGDLRALPYLLGASACLYLAGMAFNDVFDAPRDARTRPARPIPAGEVSLTTAALLAAALTVGGLLLAMSAGYNSFLAACLLIVFVLGYDAACKRNELCGPLAMGACRGANLLLGMSAHPDVLLYLSYPAVHVPPLLLAAYTACVTVLARAEAETDVAAAASPPPAAGNGEQGDEESEEADSDMETQSMRLEPERVLPPAPAAEQEKPVSLALVAPAAAALVFVVLAAAWVLPRTHLGLLIFGLLALVLLLCAGRTYRHRTAAAVRGLVGTALGGMVLLDAGMVASLAPAGGLRLPHLPLALPGLDGLAGVALVAAMLIPVLVLKRRVEMT